MTASLAAARMSSPVHRHLRPHFARYSKLKDHFIFCRRTTRVICSSGEEGRPAPAVDGQAAGPLDGGGQKTDSPLNGGDCSQTGPLSASAACKHPGRRRRVPLRPSPGAALLGAHQAPLGSLFFSHADQAGRGVSRSMMKSPTKRPAAGAARGSDCDELAAKLFKHKDGRRRLRIVLLLAGTVVLCAFLRGHDPTGGLALQRQGCSPAAHVPPPPHEVISPSQWPHAGYACWQQPAHAGRQLPRSCLARRPAGQGLRVASRKVGMHVHVIK